MNYQGEDYDVESSQGVTEREKHFSIPLMSKKLNSVEKYASSYKLSHSKIKASSRERKVDSMFSNQGSRLIFGGKYTPDERVSQINDEKSYIQYSSVKDEKTEERIEMLDRAELQYARLKDNFAKNKDPFLSKFTLQVRDNRILKKSESRGSTINFSLDQINKQLKKQTMNEKGKKIYPDLQILRKGRTKILKQIEKGKRQVSFDETEKAPSEEQSNLLQQKMKQVQEKKKKMLQKKGLHWNVYYEMMALNKNEKSKLKNVQGRFAEIYGND